MSVAMLTAVVSLAAIGAVYAAGSVAADVLPRRVKDRANLLFLQGVGPTAMALAVALGIVLPAFLRFEPPHDGERVSVLLLALAVVGAWHLLRVVIRASRMVRLSRAITTEWSTTSALLQDRRWGIPTYVVDADFPVVAVAGLFRPRIFVDRRVLATCSPAELDAIAAHERAHVVGRDNLKRLLIGACQGPASAAARAWRQAAEHAADNQAADSSQGALDLASALLSVARLAPRRTLEGTALSTIEDGGSLEVRIRHLLTIERAPIVTDHGAGAVLVLIPLACAIAFNWSALLRSAHSLTEAAVRHLP